MLSLVVTVVLLGLAASDPSPPKSRRYGHNDPYRGQRHPIIPARGHSNTKVITVPKVHREQVGILHQEAVPVHQTQVVTNERVKIVTQKQPVLVPQTKVQKILQQVPVQTVKKVAAPMIFKHKEIVPFIKERTNHVVHKIKVPKYITNTVVRKVPEPVAIPKIQTKHVHHVRTKVVHKHVPSPYRVDNYVKVPKHIIRNSPSPVPVKVADPKYIDRVHVKTQIVPKHIVHTVAKPITKIKTEYKTIHKTVPIPSPMPKHFHHVKHVDRPIHHTKTVIKKVDVPKIVEKTRYHAVGVPIVKTNTVVKTNVVDRPIPKIFNRIHTVREKIPVPYKQTVVQQRPFPVVQTKVVEKHINHVQKVPVVRNHVQTVHKHHVEKVAVPKIITQVVPQIKIQKVIEPRYILKETLKETLRPTKVATKSTVQYYQINADGQRVAISPAQVQIMISSGAISQNQIQTIRGSQGMISGGRTSGFSRVGSGMSSSRGVAFGDPRLTHGVAGLATYGKTHGIRHRAGRRRYRTNNGRYTSQSSSGPIFARAGGHMQQGVAGVAGIAGMTGGAAGGSIGAMISDLQSGMRSNAGHQGGFAQGAGVSRRRQYLPRMLQQLNRQPMTAKHIYGKVTNK